MIMQDAKRDLRTREEAMLRSDAAASRLADENAVLRRQLADEGKEVKSLRDALHLAAASAAEAEARCR